ncbi:MAG: SAM-dependent methyltransferase [Clostridia bacterium]|nr:SAM-dependent methyltransferase [Clostridia bacterium]MBQ8382047.1 SAM-dependent methyltransferase [Clostridia bacterium]
MHNEQADRTVRLPLRSEMTPRLLTAASFVREGAVVADVGTDHAYLPIYLVSAGTAIRAVASDINEGPLSRAEANVRRFGLSDRIALRLTSGLAGIEAFTPTDVLICGMGGELIASILEAAPFVRDPAIRLILQPMTSARELRLWLAANGFAVTEERFAAEKEKLYVVLCASFCGKPYEPTDADSYAGCGHDQPLYGEWLRRQIASLQKQVNGLAKAGREDLRLNALVDELQERLDAHERNQS